MSSSASPRSPLRSPWTGVLLGVAGGLALLALARLEGDALHAENDVAIEINGLSMRMARDLLLPAHGWVLGVTLPGYDGQAPLAGVELELREERTGMTIRLEDRLQPAPGRATLVVPEALRLSEGLLAIRASRTDAEGRRAEDFRRVRVRRWLGGPPIGLRQVVFFDFGVDRDGDGRADFERDLEQAGLAAADHPALARRMAERVAALALARVERAYAGEHDPNHTGRSPDPVQVRFVRQPEPGPFVTRICVGGTDPIDPTSVGHVDFDLRNARHASVECDGDPPKGVFPGGLSTYAEDEHYRRVFDPLRPDRGGTPVGAHPLDAGLIEDALARAGDGARTRPSEASTAPGEADTAQRRSEAISRACEVFAHALGSLLAHEAGHSLGLVAPGKPGVGLFGAETGEVFAHNLDVEGRVPEQPALMNPGRSLRFAELAGESEAGELRFRALNHAYLRDRVVLVDGRD